MAAFNAAATIRDALASIAAQTRPPDEVVVVDDGSTDDTAAVARAAGATVISTANAGAASARNTGVDAARHAWIAFLDADDVWVPGKLERQIAAMDDGPMSYTDATIIGPEREQNLSAIWPCPSGHILETLLLNNIITLSSVIVRRDVLQGLGGFATDCQVVHDWPLWLKIAAKYPIAYVDAPLVRYRVSPTGLSRDLSRTVPEHLFVVQQAFAPGGVAHHLPHLRSLAIARAYQVVGYEAARGHQWGAATSLFARQVAACPTDPGGWKWLTKVALAAAGLRPFEGRGDATPGARVSAGKRVL